ncbi:hypothetical protein SERLA73DRAFT_78636 [Serpula lacrymans var. lacrymans S7.3]|uniref:Uncharacterized protein n=1 Tax=Serpula lacrymans var. lacrymans (strain S7.3) TaxID=936435 RepID=F8QDV1_SERL3|nr:hypothetical protein SERLA73DRAFT_78636 [Serpula lacrymans var. lacrymans S7.3]
MRLMTEATKSGSVVVAVGVDELEDALADEQRVIDEPLSLRGCKPDHGPALWSTLGQTEQCAVLPRLYIIHHLAELLFRWHPANRSSSTQQAPGRICQMQRGCCPQNNPSTGKKARVFTRFLPRIEEQRASILFSFSGMLGLRSFQDRPPLLLLSSLQIKTASMGSDNAEEEEPWSCDPPLWTVFSKSKFSTRSSRAATRVYN